MLKNRIFTLFFAVLILTMTVSVNAENYVYSSNDKAGKKIALTFDDGPHPKITSKILDILDKYGVKATFFVIGTNVKNYPDQISRIYEKGHEIGNHTYSHNILKSMPKSKIEKEIFDTIKEVEKICDYKPKILRPPCGIFDYNLEKIAVENNYKIVLWNIDTNDWAHSSSSSIVKNVIKNVKDGAIILFHDYISGDYYSLDALETLIPILLEQGYEFVTITQLLQ